LPHRIDVDTGTGTLAIVTFQKVRDTTGKFHDFQTALDIALSVRDNLAMFGRQQPG
jgi:hypothetical protein